MHKEQGTPYSVFCLVMDYYSNPEVIIITAEDIDEARAMYQKMGTHEESIRRTKGLEEIDTFIKAIFVLRPPGNRDLR